MELNQDMSVRGWCFWKIAVDNGILNTFHVITAILKSEIKRKQKQLLAEFNHLESYTRHTQTARHHSTAHVIAVLTSNSIKGHPWLVSGSDQAIVGD